MWPILELNIQRVASDLCVPCPTTRRPAVLWSACARAGTECRSRSGAVFIFSERCVQPMTQESTKHSGEKTSEAQQRINHALSVASLSRLLQLNFSQGAYLIRLAYDPARYVPTGVYAAQDIQDWIRWARHQMGTPPRYIRTMEQCGNKLLTVHHVVISCCQADAEKIAAKWAHGSTWVRPVEPRYLPALAHWFSRRSAAEAGRRTWSPSKGLVRS